MKAVRVAAAAEVVPGKGRLVVADGHELAVFNVDGCFYAIDNACAHLGGPLADGIVQGKVVTCPWHDWAYDVSTGIEVLNGEDSVRCYKARQEDDGVVVELP